MTRISKYLQNNTLFNTSD